MTSETLLAHLTSRFVTQAENLATESLAFLLARHPVATDAFERFLREFQPSLPRSLSYFTQNWAAEDQAIPDLIGVAAGNSQPLVIEAKFWAGLTENQPVTYLGRLPDDAPGLLLFIAPAAREQYLWNALLERCADAGIAHDLRSDRTAARSAVVRSGSSHILAVTSWTAVLGAVGSALELAAEHAPLSDLRQLQGLCDRMDEEAFLPITSEELTGDIGRRLEQLGALIDSVVEQLRSGGHADTTGLMRSAGTGWFGRYFKLAGWESLLHVNFNRWARQRPTPMWLRVTDRRVTPGHPLVAALTPLRLTVPPRLLTEDGRVVVALMLPVGADRDEAQRVLTNQLMDVAALMEDVERT